MKIGILTFHKSINYGSVLQAWALRRALSGTFPDVEIIDYEPDMYSFLYDVYRKGFTLRNIKYNLKRFPAAGILRRQQETFSRFRSRHLGVSRKKYRSDSDFGRLAAQYDCIICGSDQIWNLRALDCDPVYFLPFEFGGRKIAYAVSVNTNDFSDPRCDDRLKAAMLDFHAISCRESSGADKLAGFLGTGSIDVMPDPTLLHPAEAYSPICAERIIHRPYIFLYNVWSMGDVVDAAKRLSQKTGLPVYALPMNRDAKALLRLRAGGIRVLTKHSSPEEFLSLIRYAELVVTDSFHGTAFSLIFEKNFAAINERAADGTLTDDERIVNILRQLGLSHRYITAEQADTLDALPPADYARVTPARTALAADALSWLRAAISDPADK